ncbi:MAG TPA: uroporphyrinogen decarboxylase family protein [archaeon]|nr:uroporphyrinogen decarboxylase family protein [archaeon]
MSEKPRVMIGRQRILAAFEHRAPDRVPLFDQSISSEVASAVIGKEMLVGGGSLRFREVEARYKSPEAAAGFEARLLEDVALFYRTMGYDMARLSWRDTRLASRKIDRYTYLFGDRRGEEPWEIYRYSPESGNWHVLESWLAGGNVEKLCAHLERENRLWQGPDTDPARLVVLWKFKALVGDDLALAATVASLGIPMWEPAWLMALEVAPDLVASELDRQTEQGIADIALAAELGADVIHAGMDFCLNSGPVFSPETFDRLYLPRLKRLTQACDKHGVRYVFRTDGNTWPVADSLFGKSGAHAYGEIDYGAGMRLKELRERFPRLTLFGNLDCGGALILGTAQEVREVTRRNLEETGGIGHIFGASNAIMSQTPVENYLAMLDEAQRFSI